MENPVEHPMTTTSNDNVILQLEDGNRWIEITTDEAAMQAGQITQTAIGHFYKDEQKHEEGHPRRWFVLAGPNEAGVEIGKVALCIVPPGVAVKNSEFVADCHVTGFQNRNAYPSYTDEIAALADKIEIEITPNYQGNPISPENTSSAPRPPRL
jgi:hypothetical protein